MSPIRNSFVAMDTIPLLWLRGGRDTTPCSSCFCLRVLLHFAIFSLHFFLPSLPFFFYSLFFLYFSRKFSPPTGKRDLSMCLHLSGSFRDDIKGWICERVSNQEHMRLSFRYKARWISKGFRYFAPRTFAPRVQSVSYRWAFYSFVLCCGMLCREFVFFVKILIGYFLKRK